MKKPKLRDWARIPRENYWYSDDPCMCGHQMLKHDDEQGCDLCHCPTFELDVDGLLDDLDPDNF